MRGSVRRDGASWGYVIDVGPDPATGRRRQRRKRGFTTKKAAQAALTDVMAELRTGTYREPTSETLGAFLGRWLDGMASQVKPSTLAGYRAHAGSHVLPRVGATPLRALDGPTLNALYADLLTSGGRKRDGVSARTVGHVHKLLHRAMRDAVRWGLLARNPADDADPPRVERRAPSTWTPEETRRFLASVENVRLEACWWVALTAGLRRGELLGLRWADVDLDARRASITQTIVAAGYKLTIGPPKSQSSERRVALAEPVVAKLSEHRRRQLEERLAIGSGWRDHDLVFCRVDGSPIHPQTLTFWWFQAIEAAGLPRIRLHDARHTVATTALRAGVHPKVVADQLGHASISITLDTYSHVVEGLHDDAVATIADVIQSAN